YFFLPEQLLQIFSASPPPSGAANQDEDDGSGGEQAEAIPSRDVEGDAGKDYATVQLAVDRRLLVNRREQKRMYRNWVQAKLRRL
ncbi:hypothetical protein OC835_004953, partial [Tilletia horrida]